jgi:isochorismate synthase EntC
MSAYSNIPNKSEELNEHLKVIEMIREELETSLKQLSNPSEGIV